MKLKIIIRRHYIYVETITNETEVVNLLFCLTTKLVQKFNFYSNLS